MTTANQALIVQGDALRLPLPDGSVDLIVTSPPYLWKRKYAIEGTGELGNERNWREYLGHLWAATDEMLRVLKPTGSIFVNLGDTRVAGREPKWLGVPPKSRLLLPERYRVGCQDRYLDQGVIVRQVQIWEKANGLPESTVDRTRDSHEDFVHLTKQPRYYSAIDEVRELHNWTRDPTTQRLTGANGADPSGQKWSNRESGSREYYKTVQPQGREYNPLGKLPGSVWTIPSEPLRLPDHLGVQHYAAFPSEWPRRLILAFSPPGICVDCGQGRGPVVEREQSGDQERVDKVAGRVGLGSPRRGTGPPGNGLNVQPTTILGYACACTPQTNHPGSVREGPRNSGNGWAAGTGDRDNPGGGYGNNPGGGYGNNPRTGPWREYYLDGWKPPPTRPAVVLDCFSGTGTVPMVARALDRIGIGIDLSYAYCRAARWRVHHDAAKAISRTNLERQGSLL